MGLSVIIHGNSSITHVSFDVFSRGAAALGSPRCPFDKSGEARERIAGGRKVSVGGFSSEIDGNSTTIYNGFS